MWNTNFLLEVLCVLRPQLLLLVPIGPTEANHVPICTYWWNLLKSNIFDLLPLPNIFGLAQHFIFWIFGTLERSWPVWDLILTPAYSNISLVFCLVCTFFSYCSAFLLFCFCGKTLAFFPDMWHGVYAGVSSFFDQDFEHWSAMQSCDQQRGPLTGGFPKNCFPVKYWEKMIFSWVGVKW